MARQPACGSPGARGKQGLGRAETEWEGEAGLRCRRRPGSDGEREASRLRVGGQEAS